VTEGIVVLVLAGLAVWWALWYRIIDGVWPWRKRR